MCLTVIKIIVIKIKMNNNNKKKLKNGNVPKNIFAMFTAMSKNRTNFL